MKRSLTILAIVMLLATSVRGDIKYYGTSGQTFYARVQTGATTFVACALTEGSGGGVGVYTATDAELVTAGLSTANYQGHTFTIRVGTPSTTANDPIVGFGQIAWSGSAEVPMAVNVTQFGGSAGTFSSGRPEVNVTHISGDSGAADNAERFFDGSGYGPILLRTTVGTVGSQTFFQISGEVVENEDAYVGCTVVISDGVFKCIRTIIDHGIQEIGEFIIIDSAPNFTLESGAVVEILAPGFVQSDRTAATTAQTKINGLTITSGRVNADVTHWLGNSVVTPNVMGVPIVDIKYVLGSPVCD